MIVDNQKNQEKEIKLILQLLNAIKAKHTYPFKKRRREKRLFSNGWKRSWDVVII